MRYYTLRSTLAEISGQIRASVWREGLMILRVLQHRRDQMSRMYHVNNRTDIIGKRTMRNRLGNSTLNNYLAARIQCTKSMHCRTLGKKSQY